MSRREAPQASAPYTGGKLGPGSALALGVGGMIGVALFAFPSTTAQLAGDYNYLAWGLAGLLMVLVGLVYSELATRFPLSGGPVRYPYLVLEALGRRGLGEFLSYLEGVGFALGWTIAVVVSAIVLPQYLSYLIPQAAFIPTGAALLSIAVVVGLNALGLRPAGRTNLALTLALALVLIGVSTQMLAQGDRAPVQSGLPQGPTGFLAATAIAMGAYGAWVGITAVAGEVRNPRATVPRTVVTSIVIVALFYTFTVYALQHVASPHELSSPEAMWAPLAYGASKLGPGVARLMALAAVLAILTTMIVGVASIARGIKALADLGHLPRVFSREYRGEPLPGLLLTLIIAGGLSTQPQLFWKMIVVGLLVGTLVPYWINIGAYLLLENPNGNPHGPRAFMAPGGRVTGMLAFLAISVAGVNLGLQELLASLATLGLLVLLYAARLLLRR